MYPNCEFKQYFVTYNISNKHGLILGSVCHTPSFNVDGKGKKRKEKKHEQFAYVGYSRCSFSVYN